MKLSIYSTWLIFLTLAAASPLSAAEITGKVRDASGDNATVMIDGDALPAVGDSAEIFFKLPGAEEEIFVASGKVAAVDAKVVNIKIEKSTDAVATDQLARITSENQQKRSAVVTMTPAPAITATPATPTAASPPATASTPATLATTATATIPAIPSAPVKGAPNEATRYSAEGLAKLDGGDLKGAIAAYTKSIELDPTHPKAYAAYANRGVAYAALKQAKRGLVDVNEAIRLDPSREEAYVIRGNIYADLHQLKRAIADYDEAIRLDPKKTSAYYSRGTVYVELRQVKRAIEDFSQAIALRPTYKEAYWNRAECYKAIGKAQLAKRDFAKFEELKAEASSSSPAQPAPVPPDQKE